MINVFYLKLSSIVGSIKIVLWEQNITDLNDGSTYKFNGVKVKEFNGRKHLTTTPSTTFEVIDENFPQPSCEALNTRRTLQVQKIEMLSNFSSYFVCKLCKKQLTEVTAFLFKISVFKTTKCYTSNIIFFYRILIPMYVYSIGFFIL